MIEQQNDPGVAVPPHYHTREEEIFHVLEGQVRYTANGESVLAGPGTTVSIPRNMVHSFEFVTQARVLLTLVPAGIEGMFRKLSELPEGSPDFEQVARICAEYGIIFVQ
jgi:quercetin dioxygenase-like cupin family protein